MNRDINVFIAVVVFACAGLAYSYGYQHGQEIAPCPEQNGYVVAYSIKQGYDLKCVYVEHHRGLVLKKM